MNVNQNRCKYWSSTVTISWKSEKLEFEMMPRSDGAGAHALGRRAFFRPTDIESPTFQTSTYVRRAHIIHKTVFWLQDWLRSTIIQVLTRFMRCKNGQFSRFVDQHSGRVYIMRSWAAPFDTGTDWCTFGRALPQGRHQNSF